MKKNTINLLDEVISDNAEVYILFVYFYLFIFDFISRGGGMSTSYVHIFVEFISSNLFGSNDQDERLLRLLHETRVQHIVMRGINNSICLFLRVNRV